MYMRDFYLASSEIPFCAARKSKLPIHQILSNRIFFRYPGVSHGTSVILCEEFFLVSLRRLRVHLTRSQEMMVRPRHISRVKIIRYR